MLEGAIPAQKHGETEHGLFGFAQPQQFGDQSQIADQRQLRAERHPRQFRAPLFEEMGKTIWRPGVSAPTLVRVPVLVRLGVVGFGQTGQGQEFVVVPTAVVMERMPPTPRALPVQQQGQVDQPAAQQRPIGGRVVVCQRQEGLMVGLQEMGKSHEALQSGE